MNEQDRLRKGRKACPTYAILDSQSSKTQYNSDDRGVGWWEKIKGRKRHISTDIEGRLLHVRVHAGNIHSKKAGVVWRIEPRKSIQPLKAFQQMTAIEEQPKHHIQIDMGLKREISKKIKPG